MSEAEQQIIKLKANVADLKNMKNLADFLNVEFFLEDPQAKMKLDHLFLTMQRAPTKQLEDRIKARRGKIIRLDLQDERSKTERLGLMIEIYGYQKLLKRRKAKDVADAKKKEQLLRIRRAEENLLQEKQEIRLKAEMERLQSRRHLGLGYEDSEDERLSLFFFIFLFFSFFHFHFYFYFHFLFLLLTSLHT